MSSSDRYADDSDSEIVVKSFPSHDDSTINIYMMIIIIVTPVFAEQCCHQALCQALVACSVPTAVSK